MRVLVMWKRKLEPNIVLNNAKFYVERINETECCINNVEFFVEIILPTSPNQMAP